jgi:hypothetical protein
MAASKTPDLKKGCGHPQARTFKGSRRWSQPKRTLAATTKYSPSREFFVDAAAIFPWCFVWFSATIAPAAVRSGSVAATNVNGFLLVCLC